MSLRRKFILLFSTVVAFCCTFDGLRLYRLLNSDYLYQKDFPQFYLMGLALRSGRYLYLPIPELAQIFNPTLGHFLSHASAYPPIVALVGLPFSFLPYFWATALWTLLELVCLVVSSILILREFGGRRASTPVILSILVFWCWRPVYVDLYLGQIMLFILLVLTLTWICLRRGHDLTAGLLLGVVFTVKLYGWPLILFLVLKGRWKSVGAAAAIFIASNLLMIELLGSGPVLDYYLKVGPSVAAIYQTDIANFSVLISGRRLYGSLGSVVLFLGVAVITLGLAMKTRNADRAYMIVLVGTVILQPISWIHYLVTLLPAFCLIGSRRMSRFELIVALLLIVLTLLGFNEIATRAPAMWATWTPFIFVLGVMWLISGGHMNEDTIVSKERLCQVN